MKTSLKLIGFFLFMVVAMLAVLYVVENKYINEVYKNQANVQSSPTEITIPTDLGFDVSACCIGLTATPNEFKDYFESALANDTINQIIITGQRIDNETRKIKWEIVYNKYSPTQ